MPRYDLGKPSITLQHVLQHVHRATMYPAEFRHYRSLLLTFCHSQTWHPSRNQNIPAPLLGLCQSLAILARFGFGVKLGFPVRPACKANPAPLPDHHPGTEQRGMRGIKSRIVQRSHNAGCPAFMLLPGDAMPVFDIHQERPPSRFRCIGGHGHGRSSCGYSVGCGPRKRPPLKWIKCDGASATHTSVSQAISPR